MKKKSIMPVVCTILALLFLFGGCLPFADKKEKSTTVLQDETSLTTQESQITATSAQATTQEAPPQVITYYTLSNTEKIDQYFTAGFDVKLPKIDSDKPGAQQINNEINELKINIENHSNAAGDLSTYREYTECSYETAMKDSVIFIVLKTAHGLMESEYSVDNYYYTYDYAADKTLSNTDIALMFNLSAPQVVDKVNAALVQKGAEQVTGFDKIDLFVNSAGKLMADAKVESMMGGDYSELITLT